MSCLIYIYTVCKGDNFFVIGALEVNNNRSRAPGSVSLKQKYSRLSLSLLGLSRITAYLDRITAYLEEKFCFFF